MNEIKKTYSFEETEQFACEFGKTLGSGAVIALSGDLGAGKTVFARGVARGLGVDEPVTSPTFTIAQEYKLKNGRRLCHLDLYRIDDVEAGLAFGVDEFIDDPDAVVLIEWSERIEEILPSNRTRVFIRHLGEDEREISIQKAPTPEG